MRSWFRWEFNCQFLIHLLLGKIGACHTWGVCRCTEGSQTLPRSLRTKTAQVTPSGREGKTYLWHCGNQTLLRTFPVIGKGHEHLSVDDIYVLNRE